MTSEQAVSSVITDLRLEPSDQHVEQERAAYEDGADLVPGPTTALDRAEAELELSVRACVANYTPQAQARYIAAHHEFMRQCADVQTARGMVTNCNEPRVPAGFVDQDHDGLG